MDHDWLFIMILQWEISSYIFSGKTKKNIKIENNLNISCIIGCSSNSCTNHYTTHFDSTCSSNQANRIETTSGKKNSEMFSFKSFQIFFLGAVSIFRQCFRVSLNMTVGTKIVLKKFSWLKNHMTTNFVQLMTLLSATIIFSMKFFNSSQCFVCMKSLLPNKPEKK